MKRLITILLLCVGLFLNTPIVMAVAPRTLTGEMITSASYNRTRNSVFVIFSQTQAVSSISYVLTYTTNGLSRGTSGSLYPKGKSSVSTTIYLGSCSGKTCIAYGNLTNMKLTVTTTYKSKKITKRTYPISVVTILKTLAKPTIKPKK